MTPPAPPPRSDSRPAERADARLLRRYTRHRRPQDLEALVLRYRPLALRLAGRYAFGAHCREDLEQVAYVGLVKALQRFDPDRGVSFSSYAVPTITGELRHHCRDTAWVAHVPRAMQEAARDLRAASDELAARAGRTPTTAELADALGWPEERVVETVMAARCRASVPLDNPPTDDAEQVPAAVSERLATLDPGYDEVERRALIDPALPALTGLERRVLRMHYVAGLTQREIGDRLGLGESRVARTLESALVTLRRIVGDAADRRTAGSGTFAAAA